MVGFILLDTGTVRLRWWLKYVRMLVKLPRVVFEFWNPDLGAQLGISLNKGR